jgi:hypothetical protein
MNSLNYFTIDTSEDVITQRIIMKFGNPILSVEKLVDLICGSSFQYIFEKEYNCEFISPLYNRTILIIKKVNSEKFNCYNVFGNKVHPLQPSNTTFMGNFSIEDINNIHLKQFPVIMLGVPAYDIDGNVLEDTALISVFIPNKYIPNSKFS